MSQSFVGRVGVQGMEVTGHRVVGTIEGLHFMCGTHGPVFGDKTTTLCIAPLSEKIIALPGETGSTPAGFGGGLNQNQGNGDGIDAQ